MFYLGESKISPAFFEKGESSGDVVEATNFTGSPINTGDKVYLNNNYNTSSSSWVYDNGDFSDFNSIYPIAITYDNNYLHITRKSTDITNGSLIWTGYNEYDYTLHTFMDNGLYFGDYKVVGEQKVQSSIGYPVDKNVFLNFENGEFHVIVYDFENDTVIHDYTLSSTTTNTYFSHARGLLIGNLLYLSTGSKYSYNTSPDVVNVVLNIDTGVETEDTTGVCSNILSQYNVNHSSDYKYLFRNDSYYGSQSSTLKIWERDENGVYNFLNDVSNLCQDLQPYYNENSTMSQFFSYNDVLCVATKDTTNQLIIKYNKDTHTFTNLNIDLPILSITSWQGTVYQFNQNKSFPCISLDMSLIVIGRNAPGAGWLRACMYRLAQSPSGYKAIPYDGRHLDTNTITGKALENADVGEKFDVSTVLI